MGSFKNDLEPSREWEKMDYFGGKGYFHHKILKFRARNAFNTN